MLSRKRRRKHLLMLLGVQAGCLALGLWIHGLLVISAAHRAAGQRAQSALDARELPAAVSRTDLLAVGAITWLWTGALLIVATYMIVTPYWDALAAQHGRVEAEALRRGQSLLRTRDAVIFGLAKLAESRDRTTGDHLERVALYASRLAASARHHPRYRDVITPQFVQLIWISSALHDVGKIAIEDAILGKSGPLREAERARMQQHTQIGGEYLLEIERRLGSSDFLQMACQIALRHHERWDGSGYPDGLAGEAIPLEARIVAIADVYEALSSRRPYKSALPHEQCVRQICREGGKQFDPELVTVFLQIEGAFRAIAAQYGDETACDPAPVYGDSTPDEDRQGAGCISVVAAPGENGVAAHRPGQKG
jgi:HD-GYP domain-containing protein (c-di-GMP phosphodiesterase class II)